MSRPYRVTRRAQNDIAETLEYTRDQFGEAQCDAYLSLIKLTIKEITEDPETAPSKRRDQLRADTLDSPLGQARPTHTRLPHHSGRINRVRSIDPRRDGHRTASARRLLALGCVGRASARRYDSRFLFRTEARPTHCSNHSKAMICNLLMNKTPKDVGSGYLTVFWGAFSVSQLEQRVSSHELC